jgi:hypothetical protein
MEVNPIYIEYSSHDGADCYKIDIPYSRYKRETNVLCKVSQGYNHAKLIAIGLINTRIVRLFETLEPERK